MISEVAKTGHLREGRGCWSTSFRPLGCPSCLSPASRRACSRGGGRAGRGMAVSGVFARLQEADRPRPWSKDGVCAPLCRALPLPGEPEPSRPVTSSVSTVPRHFIPDSLRSESTGDGLPRTTGETSSPGRPLCFTGAEKRSVIGFLANRGVSVGCSPLPVPGSPRPAPVTY